MDEALKKSNSTHRPQANGLTSVEQQIHESNHGEFIQDASLSDLGACLLYCFSMSGLLVSNYPNEVNKGLLIEFFISNYPTFRIPEVRTAFQMNAAGRFGEVVDHYQNFSPTFFGKVMAGFRKKAQETRSYQDQARSWNKLPEPLHRSDEIPDTEMVACSYDNYLKVGKHEFIYPGCYKTLVNYGFGLSTQQGTDARAQFNRMKPVSSGIPEDRETQFKKYCCSLIFDDFKNQGKKEVKL